MTRALVTQVDLQRVPRMSAPRGFTLVELMVTIAILVLLLMMAVPPLARTIQNSKVSVLAANLPQDFRWARNQAQTSRIPHRIVLGAGCTWMVQRMSVDGKSWADVEGHSMTTAATLFPNATCAIDNSVSQQLTVQFDVSGLISNGVAPSIQINSGHGQIWNMQVLLSGLVLKSIDTAS